ncbi:MAG: serine protease [Pseudomonadota bacterium]
MVRFLLAALLFLGLSGAPRAQTQDLVWLQIEAQQSLAGAEARARFYARSFDNVAGFRLAGRWYGIALGPYTRTEALQELARLRSQRAIPGDSYLSDGAAFRQQFWPVGGVRQTTAPEAPAGAAVEVAAPPAEPQPAEESIAQSRASERSLTREERRDLQRALQWEGFYSGIIDGLFGPGTRGSMAQWQTANGFQPSGVLSTAQRLSLMTAYQDFYASLGLGLVIDAEAGIEITLPRAMVRFDGYAAPFARYASETDGGPLALLISQGGGQTELTGLYDILQSLEIMPLDGPREIGARAFTIEGRNDERVSFAFAEISGSAIKGFALVWPTGDDRRRDLALQEMRSSFASASAAFLPDDAGQDVTEQRIDLLAGLEIRTPDRSRSGFFVGGDGAVLTTRAAVRGCGRITLDRDVDARVAAEDSGSGLVLLRPTTPQVPIEVARLSAAQPRLQSDIAVAGYSFEGLLGAPSVTFGRLADLEGLQGQSDLKRLSLPAEDGDAGGPVLDEAGAVVGMLLPRDSNTGRNLPPDVAFAVDAGTIAAFLAESGIDPVQPNATGPIAPEDLRIRAADMTVLVSCWN